MSGRIRVHTHIPRAAVSKQIAFKAAKARRTRSKLKAYSRTNKRNFKDKRAPFVETKSRTGEEVAIATGAGPGSILNPINFAQVPNNDAFTHIDQIPYLCMQQGLGEDQMIGQSVYGKYLACKYQVKIPAGDFAILHSCPIYMVHGWVKVPYARTSFTTPTAPNVNYADIKSFVGNHVKDFLDQREDKLRFIPQSNTNIKILGYKKLKSKKDTSVSTNAQTIYATTGPSYKVVGQNPVINGTCKWSMNRKINYTPSTQAAGSIGNWFYPNSDWLPFMVLYNPTFAQFQPGNDYRLTLANNSCFWYSDS